LRVEIFPQRRFLRDHLAKDNCRCGDSMQADGKQMTSEEEYSKPFLRLPAVQAMLMQLLSLVLVMALMLGIFAFWSVKVPLLAAVLLQALAAVGLSFWRGLAPWWLAMQMVFLPGLLAGVMLHLPSSLYLFAFLFFLLLYWSTFRTQVPFYPSGSAVWAAVATQLPTARPIRFVDVGSGFGGMILHFARLRTESEFVGIELAPLPWFASRVAARLAHSRGRFLRDDYQRLDFGKYDIVFAYLSPAAMPTLWRKARTEMRAGSVLFSYEFAIREAESQIANITVVNGRNLYRWNM
jgi:SAM-dependent methyltransferase